MDSSVIFSIFKKSFIKKKKISFKSGLHEDILFMFKAYYFAKKIGYCNKLIYCKNDYDVKRL